MLLAAITTGDLEIAALAVFIACCVVWLVKALR